MKETHVSEIRKYVTAVPVFVYEDDSIHTVINKFITNPVTRAVYVVNKNRMLQGIITIQDILKRISVDFYSTSFIYSEPSFTGYNIMSSIKDSSAGDIMNTDTYSVKDDDSIEHAFSIIFQNHAGEIPVVDKQDKLIGDLNVIELLVLWEKRGKK
ncbi:MAG: hypothetical protein DRP57_08600 [Spirochaetes bacterium]|nr:MAG: hypothetical protein DRP57_08600 [Spirochaetota bacterium]